MIYFAHAGHHHETAVNNDGAMILIGTVVVLLAITAIGFYVRSKRTTKSRPNDPRQDQSS